jgi:hypothetical protein
VLGHGICKRIGDLQTQRNERIGAVIRKRSVLGQIVARVQNSKCVDQAEILRVPFARNLLGNYTPECVNRNLFRPRGGERSQRILNSERSFTVADNTGDSANIPKYCVHVV